ncbi:3007_t:CDS:2 [Cetraspora pellucida]|uniref:3007_t:CDS:1 n=1 Tax=Cetraspora pellucida TaxID=1433469 RepID=A0A9N9CZE2_9GLOM|nr:3007_t:CDS:2 [Cetraspora pellucida]
MAQNRRTSNHASDVFETKSESSINDIDYQTLNLLRVIIIRTVNTEKLYLIQALRSQLHEMARSSSDLPILVLALTGIAAFNINEVTIYSKLFILVLIRSNLDISDE